MLTNLTEKELKQIQTQRNSLGKVHFHVITKNGQPLEMREIKNKNILEKGVK
jgi:hypothetical protein